MQNTNASRRRLLFAAVGLGLGMLSVTFEPSKADQFPSRLIRFVVPFPAGSATDLSARYYARKLTELTSQSVIVDNRGGGNGIIGVRAVLDAPADGYTVLIGTTSILAVNVALFRRLPYDPVADFTPLTMMMHSPAVLAVNAKGPYNTVADLVKAAHEKPSALNYSAGTAGYQLMAELFNQLTNVKTTHIPYKGSGEAVIAVLSGQTDFTIIETSLTLSQPMLRPLLVGSRQRFELLKDVPTGSEAGLPGFEATTWVAAMVASRTPPVIATKLAELMSAIARMPETKAYFENQGAASPPAGPDELRKFQVEAIETWKRVAQRAGIQPLD